MSAKTINKDELTREKIRMDLLYDWKGDWILHLLIPPTLAFFVGMAHLACATAYAEYIPEVVLHRVIPLLWLFPAGYLAGYVLWILYRWLRGAKMRLYVAEDTLCKAKAFTRFRGRGSTHNDSPYKAYPRYYWKLYFSGHGKHTARPHATWNKAYRKDIGKIYRSFEPGDPFYLLLNRRGKILLAYPCKYFTWKEPRE